MVSCVVRHCRNNDYLKKVDPTKRNLRFFPIPKSKSSCELTAKRFKKRQDLWLQAIKRPEITAEMIQKGTCYVCSDHFISGSPSNKYLEDSEDWIPTKNLHPTPEPVQAADENGSNVNVVENDEQESSFMDSSSSSLNISGFHPLEESITDKFDTSHENVSVEFQTPTSATQRLQDRLTDCEVDKLELQAKTEKLEKENEDLKKELAASKERFYEEIKKRQKIERESSVKISSLAQQASATKTRNSMIDKTEFFCLKTFSSDDAKIKFYTGLPNYGTFQWVLEVCGCHMKMRTSYYYSLETWQRLLLTLMRLRLSLLLQDLAYRFGISVTNAGEIFNLWLDLLHRLLSPLITWPSREVLTKVMPREFRENYGSSVVCIIDCFEIYCEKPSSLKPRAETFSKYKNHNTVKVLIGISPTGCISFVSTCWGGRASDKEVANQSGIYELLLPYDVLMADRGFTIAHEVALRGAKLLIPAFTKGVPQLTNVEVGLTRKIAHLRVHVERVIGLVRNKYRLLKTVLPTDLLRAKKNDTLPSIDKIVQVCCALTNLSPSVVHRGSLEEEEEDEDEEDDGEEEECEEECEEESEVNLPNEALL